LGSAGKPVARAKAPPRRGGSARVLRIIGGSWRGRRLRFPDRADIRPTPDRVRETLFNWLGPAIGGARCLDLFAGSGALGLEALSRGAAHVTFIEQDAVAARALRALLQEWQGSGGEVECSEALAYLARGGVPCDVVFLDPPFAAALLVPALRALIGHGWLKAAARIYVEVPARSPALELPGSLRLLKSGRAGEVGYHLYAYAPAPPTDQT
jgi:16S rRNA (guanine966-N2)-methyltransferase